jgi:tripartite-type tricarboxylate transporter receptor subunit TctC
MDPKNARWDVAKMRYIGSFAPSNAVLARRKDAPAKTAADLFKVKSNVGCTGRSSQSFQYPSALKVLGGAQFNIICGYDGSAAYTLALLRGEVDLISKAWAAWLAEDQDHLKDGTFVPVLQGGLKRLKDLPDVPLMQEVVDDPKAKRALEFMSAGSAIGRALIAPPNVPAERLAALRTAFDKVVKDAAFIADVRKRHLPLAPEPGAEVQKDSEAVVKTPKDVLELTAKAFEG